MFLLSLQPEIQVNICKLQKIDQIELCFMNAHMFRPDFLFVCLFVVLRPKSTAMVIAGRSVHLITLFPGQA